MKRLMEEIRNTRKFVKSAAKPGKVSLNIDLDEDPAEAMFGNAENRMHGSANEDPEVELRRRTGAPTVGPEPNFSVKPPVAPSPKLGDPDNDAGSEDPDVGWRRSIGAPTAGNLPNFEFRPSIAPTFQLGNPDNDEPSPYLVDNHYKPSLPGEELDPDLANHLRSTGQLPFAQDDLRYVPTPEGINVFHPGDNRLRWSVEMDPSVGRGPLNLSGPDQAVAGGSNVNDDGDFWEARFKNGVKPSKDDPELHPEVAKAYKLPEGLRYKELPNGMIQPYRPGTGPVYDPIDPSMGFSYDEPERIMVPGQTMPYKPTDPDNPDLIQEYNNKLYEDYYGLNPNPYSPGIPEEDSDPMIFGDAMPEAPEGPENPPSELEPGPATPNHFADNAFTGTLGPIEMIDENSPVLPLNPGSRITPTDEMRRRFSIPEGAFIVRSSDNESYQIVDPRTGEHWPLNGSNVTNETDTQTVFNSDDYAEWYAEHPEALSSGEEAVDMRPLTGADIDDAHFLEGEGLTAFDEDGDASRSLVGDSVDSGSAGDSSADAAKGITLPDGSVSMVSTPYYGPGGSSGYINPGTGTLNLGTTLLGGLGGTIPYTGSPFDSTSGAGGVTGGSGAGGPVAPVGMTRDLGGTGGDAGTGDAAGGDAGESAPEAAPVVAETPAGPQLMTNLRLKGGTDIDLGKLKYYQGADGRFYSDKEGRNPVDERAILSALAKAGKLPGLHRVEDADKALLRSFIGSQAYRSLLPDDAKGKDIVDIWWDSDDNGMPVLKYQDSTGAIGERSYDSLLELFATKPSLAKAVNRYGLIDSAGHHLWSNLSGGEYAYAPDAMSGLWDLRDDGRFARPIGYNTIGGEPRQIYVLSDGTFEDSEGNPIAQSAVLGDLGYANPKLTYKYKDESGEEKSFSPPPHLRTRIVPSSVPGKNEIQFFDPVTWKRVSRTDLADPEYVAKNYPGVPTGKDIVKDPTFNLAEGNNFTLDQYKFVPNDDGTYDMVLVSPGAKGGTETIVLKKGLTSDKIRSLFPDAKAKKLYPLTLDSPIKVDKGRGASKVVVLKTGNPDKPYIYRLYANDGAYMDLNPENSYHKAILDQMINDPSYTMGDKGLVSNTLDPENLTLVSNPYVFGEEPERTGEPMVAAAPPETPVDPDKMDEEEKTIFTEKVKKYIALGIPVGLAVSMAMWALGGAKSENMLGALAAGAGGGALLGGLGAHLGYLGNEEGDAGTAPAEDKPGGKA